MAPRLQKIANKTRQTTTMNCILKGNGSVGTFGYFLAPWKCQLLAHPSIARQSRYLSPRPQNLPIKVVKQLYLERQRKRK